MFWYDVLGDCSYIIDVMILSNAFFSDSYSVNFVIVPVVGLGLISFSVIDLDLFFTSLRYF